LIENDTIEAHESIKAKGEVDAAALKVAGQRRVNIIWEVTQAVIAILVTSSTLFVASSLAFRQSGDTTINLLSNAFFLVVGFYFSRTNHTRTGGVGGENVKEGR